MAILPQNKEERSTLDQRLRKIQYITQMKIFKLVDRSVGYNKYMRKGDMNDIYDDGFGRTQSWFPSDFTATGSDLNESVSCMNMYKHSGAVGQLRRGQEQ